jgi:hypothetical protein
MDTTNYTLNDATGATVTLPGAAVNAFLTGIVGSGKASQNGHQLATTFGSPDAALAVLFADATLGATLLVQNVYQIRNYGNIPDASYNILAGIGPGAATVHFFATRWGNQWVSYDAAVWRTKVSHYGVSSYKENFAEMYTAKFTGGTLPGPNNGLTPIDFFQNLEQADPTELGLPAYAPGPAHPGTPSGTPARDPSGGAVASATPSSQGTQPGGQTAQTSPVPVVPPQAQGHPL